MCTTKRVGGGEDAGANMTHRTPVRGGDGATNVHQRVDEGAGIVPDAIQSGREGVDVLAGLGLEPRELRRPDEPLAIAEVVVHGAVRDTDPLADLSDPDAGLALGLENSHRFGDERVDLGERPRLLRPAPRGARREKMLGSHRDVLAERISRRRRRRVPLRRPRVPRSD